MVDVTTPVPTQMGHSHAAVMQGTYCGVMEEHAAVSLYSITSVCHHYNVLYTVPLVKGILSRFPCYLS